MGKACRDVMETRAEEKRNKSIPLLRLMHLWLPRTQLYFIHKHIHMHIYTHMCIHILQVKARITLQVQIYSVFSSEIASQESKCRLMSEALRHFPVRDT